MKTSTSLGGLFKKADTWLLTGLAVMGIVFFFDTFHYRPAAALFPRIVSGVVAILCLYELGGTVWAAVRGKPLAEKRRKEEAPTAIAWYWVALVMALYLALIPLVGFNLATLAFMLAFPPLVGYRRWIVIVPFAVIMTVAVAYAFGSILHVMLPTGLLGSALGW